MSQDKTPTILPCPTCKKSIQWSDDNAFRPFCSERCKLIDLGAWASEEHSIPGPPADFTDPDYPQDKDFEE